MTTETLSDSARRLAPSAPNDIGSRRVPTWAAVLVIAIVALIAIYGIGVAFHSMNGGINQAHDAQNGVVQNGNAAVARFTVTMAEFDAVQAGMSLPQVQTILHSNGTQEVHDDTAGITGDIYSWQNSDGSNMNVQFQNGAVITKAQFGLQ